MIYPNPFISYKGYKNEEELKNRWKEMTLQASEDRRWVNEQREEGMEKHKMRMSDARVLGALDAELTSATVDRTEWERRRRGHYKQNVDSTADDSDDSGDSESKRIFGSM